MIATASKPIRKRRQTRARRPRRTGSVYAKPLLYADFSPRVQVGPNLYAGYFGFRMSVDPWGLLTLNIAELAYETANPQMSGNLRALGVFAAKASLSCECIECPINKCKKIECIFETRPTVILHSDPQAREFYDSIMPDPPGSVKKHEENHFKVWQNVYLPSYINLISQYEVECCTNCEERKTKLIEQYKKLRRQLFAWETRLEYGSVPKKEPFIDYGNKRAIMKLKDGVEPCIKKELEPF